MVRWLVAYPQVTSNRKKACILWLCGAWFTLNHKSRDAFFPRLIHKARRTNRQHSFKGDRARMSGDPQNQTYTAAASATFGSIRPS
jgi:hypothetical protein